MPECQSCHQNILWATTISGRKVPLNPTPSWKGRYILEEGRTGEKFARVVSGRPTGPNRYQLHIPVCPANQETGRA